MSLTIAIVTDIHHGKDAEAKKGASALRLMADFAAFVAQERPDFVLDLGDRISDEDPETDVMLEREVNAAFEPIRAVCPVHHICGNHDRDFLSVAQNEEILGQSLAHQVLDSGGWRVVLWRADTLIQRPVGFQCPEADIAWLARTIAEADRPLLIASHVPVSGHSQIGNYYFQRNPGSSTYPQHAEQIRDVLRTSKVPTLCLAGHVHWNTVSTIDGIPHLTQQSLTESYVMSPQNGAGEACGAYGMLKLSDEAIDWQVFGSDAFRAIIPVAQTARRWYRPLAEFNELPGHLERAARIAAFQAKSKAAE
ncbi:cpdA 3',5'-cyclic adenosine monophosphate phosphodiesterase CpdA [Rhabdaerophilaceae bacterium]